MVLKNDLCVKKNVRWKFGSRDLSEYLICCYFLCEIPPDMHCFTTLFRLNCNMVFPEKSSGKLYSVFVTWSFQSITITFSINSLLTLWFNVKQHDQFQCITFQLFLCFYGSRTFFSEALPKMSELVLSNQIQRLIVLLLVQMLMVSFPSKWKILENSFIMVNKVFIKLLLFVLFL